MYGMACDRFRHLALSGEGTRVSRVPQQRQVIDYALARRATLADVARGRLAPADVCDAHPDLLRAARFHGEPADTSCPICRNAHLVRVSYAYGDELLHASGRARSSRTLDALERRCANVRIYEVEVCRSCSWNHLIVSYLIGTAETSAGGTPDPAGSGARKSAGPDSVPVSDPSSRRAGDPDTPEPRKIRQRGTAPH